MKVTTKSYLEQIKNIDNRIKDKIAEAEKWRDIAYSRSYGSSKGQQSTDFVKSSHNPDKVIDAIIKSVDYQMEAEKESKEMVEVKHTIETQIDSIKKDDYYNILHAYYVEEKTLSIIADETFNSLSTAKRKFKQAIRHFEELYGDTYKS